MADDSDQIGICQPCTVHKDYKCTLMCLSIETTNIINFPFVLNGKFKMFLGVSIFKPMRVFYMQNPELSWNNSLFIAMIFFCIFLYLSYIP